MNPQKGHCFCSYELVTIPMEFGGFRRVCGRTRRARNACKLEMRANGHHNRIMENTMRIIIDIPFPMQQMQPMQPMQQRQPMQQMQYPQDVEMVDSWLPLNRPDAASLQNLRTRELWGLQTSNNWM